MSELSNVEVPNTRVNSDLRTRTESPDLNLYATLEQALKNNLAEKASKKWLDDNKGAIRAYNNFVAEAGCFSDDDRDF